MMETDDTMNHSQKRKHNNDNNDDGSNLFSSCHEYPKKTRKMLKKRPLAPSLDFYLKQTDDYAPRPEWCLPPVLLRPNTTTTTTTSPTTSTLSPRQEAHIHYHHSNVNQNDTNHNHHHHHQWNHYPHYPFQQSPNNNKNKKKKNNDENSYGNNIGEGITFEREYNTALHIAIRNDATEAALELLSHGASINIANIKGVTPLILASQRGNIQIVQQLLLQKANTSASTLTTGTTALIQACHFGHLPVVQLLLQAGANMEQANYKRTTALMRACQEGHTSIVHLLLDHGCHVNRTNHETMSALSLASHRGHATIVRLLIEKGNANMDVPTCQKSTCLMLAVKRKFDHVVTTLVGHGCNIHLKDARGRTAHDTATKRNLYKYSFFFQHQYYIMKLHQHKQQQSLLLHYYHLYQQARATTTITIQLTPTNHHHHHHHHTKPEQPKQENQSNNRSRKNMLIQQVMTYIHTTTSTTTTTTTTTSKKKKILPWLVYAFTVLPSPILQMMVQYLPLPNIYEKRLSLLTHQCHVDPDSTIYTTFDFIDDVLSQSGFEHACQLANIPPPQPLIPTVQPFQTWSEWKAFGNLCDLNLIKKIKSCYPSPNNQNEQHASFFHQNEDELTFVELRRRLHYLQLLHSSTKLSNILSSPPYNMPISILSKLQANHDMQSLIRRPILSSNTTNTTQFVRPTNHNNGVHFEVHVAVELVMLANQLLLWHQSLKE